MFNWGALTTFVSDHGAQLHALALLYVLRRTWHPFLRPWLRREHYRMTAATPQLHYQRTPENDALLAGCATMTTHKYYPPWFLFNGHLQTVMLSRESKEGHPLIVYERQTLDMPDGGIISLDWALPPRANGSIPRVSELDPNRRTMLLLPGLTGGSNEYYIRSVARRMVRDHGWQVVVMNSRACAGTPLKTTRLFCCAYTDDLRFVLRWLDIKYSFREEALVVAGFSMGSNVLVKYLGEEKERALLTAGISVGNPFDLMELSRTMRSTAFMRHTYDAAFNRNLKDLFFNKSNAHEVFQHDPRIDVEAVRASKTLTEFDDRVTRRAFDYESVFHYYADASSNKHIADVAVPLLCLSAEDDPISPAAAIPYQQVQQNPNVILCVTKYGGHLAFYEDSEGAQEELERQQKLQRNEQQKQKQVQKPAPTQLEPHQELTLTQTEPDQEQTPTTEKKEEGEEGEVSDAATPAGVDTEEKEEEEKADTKEKEEEVKADTVKPIGAATDDGRVNASLPAASAVTGGKSTLGISNWSAKVIAEYAESIRLIHRATGYDDYEDEDDDEDDDDCYDDDDDDDN